MNLDIKELEIKLHNKYNNTGLEFFGGRIPSDPYLIYRSVQSVFMTKEASAVRYLKDLETYIHKTKIKTGLQEVCFNKELVDKVANLLDIFPEFQETTTGLKSIDIKEILGNYKIDMNNTASKIGLTILLSLWFMMPFIGLPAIVPLTAIWVDKKDKISTDDIETGLDILIEHIIFAYNKAFDKQVEYDPDDFKTLFANIYSAFNSLLTDKELIDASKGKKKYKLNTPEKITLINAIRRDMEPFKAFLGAKPSKNIDIAKKLSKTLNMASNDELGESFMLKLGWVIDIVRLLDMLQDVLYDCIISMSKDVFIIMA